MRFIFQMSPFTSYQPSMVKSLQTTPENGMSKLLALATTLATLAVLSTVGTASAGGRDHRDGATASTAAAGQGLAAYQAQYADVNAKAKKKKKK
jgi:hypothetical protein